jgi:hypothetical protein
MAANVKINGNQGQNSKLRRNQPQRNTELFHSNQQEVTRDRIYLFNISTAAEFSRDTPQNFDNPKAILKDTCDGLEVRQSLRDP